MGKMNRVGELSVANFNQMSMKIVAYRNACDLDIEFEDGVRVFHKTYSCFKNGKIKYPISAFVGKCKMMRNGHTCMILSANGYEDIDVIFDNGIENEHQTMSNWRAGVIGFPSSCGSDELYDYRVGEYRLMNNGVGAYVLKYRCGDDIDVIFSNGDIRENVRYSNFVRGNIAMSDKFDKLGDSNIMSNGMNAEVIAYRSYVDIDVRFEDGKIRRSVGYKEFKKGHISYYSHDEFIRCRVGETVLHKKLGMFMTLIAYRDTHDVDIQFEDGAIVQNKDYNCFCSGTVQYPIENYVPVSSRVGQQVIMNNGLLAECVVYRNTHDIDIRFVNDGVVVEHRAWYDFRMGVISHPVIKPHSSSLERNVMQYLLSNGYEIGVDFDTQKTFVENGLRGLGGGFLSYDFVIYDNWELFDAPMMKCFIECQGQQHYFPVDLFGGEKQFQIQKVHDRLKRRHAEWLGVPLLEISYLEDSYESVAKLLKSHNI